MNLFVLKHFLSCIHSELIVGIENQLDYQIPWRNYICPSCGFYFVDNMGGSLREAFKSWREYLIDTFANIPSYNLSAEKAFKVFERVKN